MDFTEIIGFLISLFAFIFLMYRRATARRNQNPQEEIDQEKRLKEFLKSLNVEIEEDDEEEERPIRPPSPPPIKKPMPAIQKQAPVNYENYRFDSKMDSYKQSFEDEYHMIQKAVPSRGRKLLSSLKSPKEMIILNEVLNRRYL